MSALANGTLSEIAGLSTVYRVPCTVALAETALFVHSFDVRMLCVRRQRGFWLRSTVSDRHLSGHSCGVCPCVLCTLGVVCMKRLLNKIMHDHCNSTGIQG